MANEDKKDFNAMLHDNKDMPKIQTITDQKSIEKYGGSKMYFAPPIDYDSGSGQGSQRTGRSDPEAVGRKRTTAG